MMIRARSLGRLVLAGAALATACQQKVAELDARPAPPPAVSAAAPARSATPPPPRPKAELVKEDLAPGKGREAKKGDRVKVHYTGTLLDGTKFDSSRDRDEPFELTLGMGMVIQGWEQGLLGMKAGGRRKLTIPGDLGYGKRGSPPKIPPDATLVFDVEMVSIE